MLNALGFITSCLHDISQDADNSLVVVQLGIILCFYSVGSLNFLSTQIMTSSLPGRATEVRIRYKWITYPFWNFTKIMHPSQFTFVFRSLCSTTCTTYCSNQDQLQSQGDSSEYRREHLNNFIIKIIWFIWNMHVVHIHVDTCR